MKKFFILLSGIIFSNAIMAQDWVILAQNTKFNITNFLDVDSIMKQPIPSQVVYSVKFVTNQEKVQYDIFQWKVDCKTKQGTILNTISYSRKNEIIHSFHYDKDKWINILPYALGEFELEAVCERIDYKTKSQKII